MVSHNAASLDAVFHALADPTRRAMLRRLASGERTIGELAAPFSMSFVAASKHVRVLEGAGVVRRRIEGRRHVCRIEAAPLATADVWLRAYERLWTAQLDALDALLTADDAATARHFPTLEVGQEQTESGHAAAHARVISPHEKEMS